MRKSILIGIDANFSLATQHALRALGDLFYHELTSSNPLIHIILLTSIPIAQTITEQPGYYIEHLSPIPPSQEERKQSEEALKKACYLLQQLHIERQDVESLICTGTPAEELTRVAHERQVHLIIVGSRGNTLRQRIRRLFMGSISRRVLALASCPVMIVTPPSLSPNKDLTLWYEEKIKHYLHSHQQTLTVFTPEQVARQFPVGSTSVIGEREIRAANRALERLAQDGRLFRHTINGEICYIND